MAAVGSRKPQMVRQCLDIINGNHFILNAGIPAFFQSCMAGNHIVLEITLELFDCAITMIIMNCPKSQHSDKKYGFKAVELGHGSFCKLGNLHQEWLSCS